ncbi:arylsulfatase [Pelagicoccus sp. SDUM812005]|uniref:arylsulfatase n=1 Tax=Pelagicoccus sp. SDUM812005 TaxID=3041257 RepID=UPI00280F4091|nr:arylsulfatase [Pelagicoccus sp. SDUM812005]MDQ8182666.1 arylsulfatase [Pelagicoccus sp. SDUM812005]
MIRYLVPIILLAASAVAAERPNILIVLADDLGYSDLGCYGGEIQTPNLDALAQNGLRYTNFYNTGRCWPSRASLMTGYYAPQVGMDPRQGKEWPSWTQLLPQRLRQAGYRNYLSGKWHLRHLASHPANAWDRSYQLADHNRFFSPEKHYLDSEQLPPVARDEGRYATIDTAQYAIDFLQEHQRDHADSPFLLYLAFTAPHFPLHAKPEDIAKYKGRYDQGWDQLRHERLERLQAQGIYQGPLAQRQENVVPHWSLNQSELETQIDPAELRTAPAWDSLTPAQKAFQASKMEVHAAMVDRLDQELGRVIDQLKAAGQFENTLILFLSDNGATAEQINRGDRHVLGAVSGSADSYLALGPGWSTAANTPLSLHKHWNHEGGISSPLIVHWPADLDAPGQLRHTPTHIVDIVPTLLEASGLDTPGPKFDKPLPASHQAPPFPGLSLQPTFPADPEWEARGLYFQHSGNKAYRLGDWKAVMRRDNANHWELYNLALDRAERNDLSTTHPQKLSQLVALWEKADLQYRIDASR